MNWKNKIYRKKVLSKKKDEGKNLYFNYYLDLAFNTYKYVKYAIIVAYLWRKMHL